MAAVVPAPGAVTFQFAGRLAVAVAPMPLKSSVTALVPGMEICAEAGTTNPASDATASDLAQM